MLSKPMLILKDVHKTFYPGTPNEKKALRGINLTLEAGDFVTILGSNGAGKSTLFNAITGGFLLDEGNILLDSKSLIGLADYKRAYEIGRLFQDTLRGTAPNMTIEENLSLAYTRKSKRHFFAVNKKESEHFREVVAMLGMGLENRMKTKVGQLSGGQRQAITLLMSTIASPKLLLLDEHTAALDPETSQKVLAITKQLVEKENITTMMITHDIQAALTLGNRTIMLDDGQVILELSKEERANMTPEGLLAYYQREKKKQLANDRMLFSITKS